MWNEKHSGDKLDDDFVCLIVDHLYYAYIAGAERMNADLFKRVKDLQTSHVNKKFLLETINQTIIE